MFRVISDRATDGSVDEEVFRLSNMDGSPNNEAIERFFAEHPERVEAMAQLAEGALLGTETAADAAICGVYLDVTRDAGEVRLMPAPRRGALPRCRRRVGSA